MYFATLVIITAYLPLFAFERVEKKLFTPMAPDMERKPVKTSGWRKAIFDRVVAAKTAPQRNQMHICGS